MSLHRNDQRRWCALLSSSSLNVLVLCALATATTACNNQKQSELAQDEAPPPVDGKKAQSTPKKDEDTLDAGAVEETRITTQKKQLDAGAEEHDASPAEPAKKPEKKSEDTKPTTSKTTKKEEQSPQDAGASETKPKTEPTKQDKDAGQDKDKVDECSRMRLQEKAEAYLKSMAMGDTMALHLHPSFRYTENGQEVQLGGGAWLRRGETQSSRTVIDETICSSLSEAVMSGLTGRFMYAVRLRYTEGQLLEAEAQFVPEVLAETDLDAAIPKTDDPFVADVPQDKRSSREELFDFAHRYFDSVTGVSNLPPSAPGCRRLQNGVPLGTGTCTEPPGNIRFEQQRFDLADEPNGVVTVTVLYNGHIGFYLLKISDHKVQNIVVVGGASSQATGW